MNIIKLIKGIIKKKEMQKLEPDEKFEYDRDYYGEITIIEGFKFTYMNNFTDKFCNKVYKQIISFISCTITLKNNTKTLLDLIKLMNKIIQSNINNLNYNIIDYEITKDNIIIYLRGNLDFYYCISNYLFNNIITKYIRNNMLAIEPDPLVFMEIETSNEYLENMYNSINNPDKEIDILFIEENIESNKYSPVIGLSIDKNCNKLSLENKNIVVINNRNILYCELNRFTDSELDYLRNNVLYGNKIPTYIHNNITVDEIDFGDVDEIIEG